MGREAILSADVCYVQNIIAARNFGSLLCLNSLQRANTTGKQENKAWLQDRQWRTKGQHADLALFAAFVNYDVAPNRRKTQVIYQEHQSLRTAESSFKPF